MMSGDSISSLCVVDLNLAYGSVPVLHNIDISVGKGEAVAVIGSNGAGKTSMLQAIMGLARGSAQAVRFEGSNILGKKSYQIARLGLGYVPEGRELFPGLTVLEELLIGGRSLDRNERTSKLNEMFVLFPRLQERQKQLTRTLSGGEQQMLAIARILMRKPSILLLDEPSLGLAPVIQDVVYETLERLVATGMPILLIEQNAFRALRLCARAYVLELGRITRTGKCADLINDPSIKAAYLGK
jgi:branched-chain amino acid transport system ATP-binding protein